MSSGRALLRASAVVGGLGCALVALSAASRGADRGASLVPAAPTVLVTGPVEDTLLDATPRFRVVASGVTGAGCDLQLTLEFAGTVDFATPLLQEERRCGDTATIVLSRALPERRTVYWRARVASAAGESAVSAVTGPRRTAVWLTLLAPNAPNGSTLGVRRPQFVWRGAPVASPPGPWRHDLAIVNVATGRTLSYAQLADTAFTVPEDLESNTSYRWSVTSRLANAQVTTANSASTFVIVDANAPLITLLYQNWPNPFPSATALNTCVWFDIARAGPVRLDIRDLRGNHVRTLVPGPQVPPVLSAGRYGRASLGNDSGCDPRFSWDGVSDSGHLVPPGLYFLRLRADGMESLRKMIFRGR